MYLINSESEIKIYFQVTTWANGIFLKSNSKDSKEKTTSKSNRNFKKISLFSAAY